MNIFRNVKDNFNLYYCSLYLYNARDDFPIYRFKKVLWKSKTYLKMIPIKENLFFPGQKSASLIKPLSKYFSLN